MLACRNCRIPLHAERGCAICTPIKRHLVAIDEDEDSRPSLADVGSDVVVELKYALRQARETMRDDGAEAKDRMNATALVLKIGNTAAKVLEAARKLQVDGLSAVRNMSFLERAKLYIGWYVELPPPYRDQIRDQQTRFENQSNKALPAPEVPDGPI